MSACCITAILGVCEGHFIVIVIAAAASGRVRRQVAGESFLVAKDLKNPNGGKAEDDTSKYRTD